MTIFITSDTHFAHANIIRLCERPFSSVDDMNAAMAERWNARIRPDDTVWHLGDFAYKGEARPFFDRLNGHKNLITGNHDSDEAKKLPWSTVKDYAEITVGEHRIVLFHYPIVEWNGRYRGSLHFHGHQHNHTARQDTRRVDAGVDANDFCPWALPEIVAVATAP